MVHRFRCACVPYEWSCSVSSSVVRLGNSRERSWSGASLGNRSRGKCGVSVIPPCDPSLRSPEHIGLASSNSLFEHAFFLNMQAVGSNRGPRELFFNLTLLYLEDKHGWRMKIVVTTIGTYIA